MIKVSVIIPVYNVEKLLRKCLDSILNQTLKDIEIIIVNDGSPDNSQQIIDEYTKQCPNTITSIIKENGGQGSARNVGISIAKGEYISFVDSDDYLSPTALEEMYNLAKKRKSDIVICDMIDHYPDKTIYHNCTKYNSIYEVTASACNKIFKRKFIGEKRFTEGIWYEDFEFTTRLLFKTKNISQISKGYYNCNCGHESTMNNNNSKKNLDILLVLENIKKYAKENKAYNKNDFEFLVFHHVLITTINRVELQHNSEKKGVLKVLLDYCKKNISDYRKQEFYKSIPRNRKIIAFLNYHKLQYISKILLKIKNCIK